MGLNANGLAVNDRRETWLFSEVETKQGKPVLKQLKWTIVQFGDDPEEFLEVANYSDFEDIVSMSGPVVQTTSGGIGRVIGFRTIKGRLCDVHAYDEYDAANIGCNSASLTGF